MKERRYKPKKVAATYARFSEEFRSFIGMLMKRFVAGFVQQRKRENYFTMVYFVIRTWGDLFGKSA
jgi:hypothetical protein